MKRGPVLVSALLLVGGMLACVAGAGAAPDPGPPADGHVARAAQADSLCRAATARLAAGGIDERRVALRELQEAVLLAPNEPRYQLAFGRACLEAGFDQQARGSFERAAALAPRDGAARLGLGRVWKRDWLLCSSCLARRTRSSTCRPRWSWTRGSATPGSCSRRCSTSTARRPPRSRPPSAPARRVPERAEAQPRRGLPGLPRTARSARAESLFTLAIPAPAAAAAGRASRTSRRCSHRRTARRCRRCPADARREFVRRFWSEADPDPTTPENEARLEFWARVAHASLVFLDPT